MNKVPKYSQFLDVTKRGWKIRSCGVTSLAMVIDHYNKTKTSIDSLIEYGASIGAHRKDIGWIHSGIVNIATHKGFHGERHDWAEVDTAISLNHMNKHLEDGPVIASVHKNFDPTLPGHLVVVLANNKTHFVIHDPMARKRENIHQEIPADTFIKGWKKRIVVIRPNIAKSKK